MLVVEQNVRRALAVADRAYVLDRGARRPSAARPRALRDDAALRARLLGV